MENNSPGELMNELNAKILLGDELILRLQSLGDIDGAMKLLRKIRQETDFLRKLQKSEKVKIEQLSCSNLRHLEALANRALKPGVLAVCKVFHINDSSKLLIDVISNEGKTWTKVIARNPKSLSAVSSGNASYGARSILDQGRDYVECAKLYPCMYQPPEVVFEFVSGIEVSLANKLKASGVTVVGNILANFKHVQECGDSAESDCGDSAESDCGESDLNDICYRSGAKDEYEGIGVLNLDVTAMMAYVSNMTNGHCMYIFKQDVLTQQSAWEAERPVKPILQHLFKGKKLLCCETAWNDFENIVNTLGGPLEKKRTADLKKIVQIFPNDYGGEDDYPRRNLKVRGNVRLRSKLIFNFGHRIKALTVSANDGFLRAAHQQGVTYAAFIHESRALTEGKEPTATKKTS